MSDQTFGPICRELKGALEALGIFQRKFFPPDFPRLREDLLQVKSSLQQARQKFKQRSEAEQLGEFRSAIEDSGGLVFEALDTIVNASTTDFQNTIVEVMKAFRKICRVQENLYQIRSLSPHLNRFFLEPEIYDRAESFDPKTPPDLQVGLHHVGLEERYYARGALSIYVPEIYDDSHQWPMVIALHGGYGHGRDFIWTWLREARSRGFILASPTSTETTWSLLNPDIDMGALKTMFEYLRDNWNIDPDRILLTGISDGATFALICSLQKHTFFSAYAPVAGVLPPANIGNAKGKRIYWVHGALDWMFPLDSARSACQALKEIGADVTLRVIDDLSHTYPREENGGILKWFDPSLALPD